VGAPDVDPRHAARGQSTRDGGQHRAATAAHIEHSLVAAQLKTIQDASPFDELAPSGRVQEADGTREEEDGEHGHPRRHASFPLPPADRGAYGTRHRNRAKDHDCVGRIEAVVSVSHGRPYRSVSTRTTIRSLREI